MEWRRSAADKGVGADASYFCSSPLPTPPPASSEKNTQVDLCGVHPGVCRTIRLVGVSRWRAVVIATKRCNYRRGVGRLTVPVLVYSGKVIVICVFQCVYFTSCASSHRSRFSSINRLLTDCTKLWGRRESLRTERQH